MLAGRGPCIRIRMQAVGSTTAKLRNAFTAAGINQTKHQILLDVTVQMSILLPGRTSTQVSNEITVAGDHHHRQRTGYLHLFQHHAGGGGAVR